MMNCPKCGAKLKRNPNIWDANTRYYCTECQTSVMIPGAGNRTITTTMGNPWTKDLIARMKAEKKDG